MTRSTYLKLVAAMIDELRELHLGIPRPEELVEWWLRLLGEVARAPFTVYRARKLVDALTDPASTAAWIDAALGLHASPLPTRRQPATFSRISAGASKFALT